MSVSALEAAQKGIGLVLLAILFLCVLLAGKVVLRLLQLHGSTVVQGVQRLFLRWPVIWLAVVAAIGLGASYIIDHQLQEARQEARVNEVKRLPLKPIEGKWVCPPPCGAKP